MPNLLPSEHQTNPATAYNWASSPRLCAGRQPAPSRQSIDPYNDISPPAVSKILSRIIQNDGSVQPSFLCIRSYLLLCGCRRHHCPAQAGPPAQIGALKVKRSCDQGSWKADPGKTEYTRPTDGVLIMSPTLVGDMEFEVTKPRSQSCKSNISLAFTDAVSLGVGFEINETFKDPSSYKYPVTDGQSGELGFTPFLLCTTGE